MARPYMYDGFGRQGRVETGNAENNRVLIFPLGHKV